MRLHKLGRLLCTLTEKHSEFLCQEVKAITQGRARLHLGAPAVSSSHIFSILPLQFNSFKYGHLSLMRDETDPDQPAIPLLTAHMIAQAISCILHMLDQHLFLQSFGQTNEVWTTINLTKREQNVLSLMCQGYTEEEIAELLTVSRATVNTHRQHIYEQLGVHNEYSARIAAFKLGLFSFLAPERVAP
ncbi:MAG TPA: LuxR C-terminal-related transcriptional regulator [Ktedonobacteraceae bacterium]|nr:LuxR C-terminal-related transcriptional regulator [Ktedonobacteraceae bacterium]